MKSFPENRSQLIETVFTVTQNCFEKTALELWEYQYQHNEIYHNYCDHILKGNRPASLLQIPFLPIRFFKTHAVVTGRQVTLAWFESSGTSGQIKSRHYISDVDLYEKSFLHTFTEQYGKPLGLCIIGLLPSYLEQGNSSLVYMVKKLIEISQMSGSGFYLYDHNALSELLKQNERNNIPTVLIGVTYALITFFETFSMKLKNTIVMETGGMKGRKKELLKKEVHEILKTNTGLLAIHSEYGMTELFSQAYSLGDGFYQPASTMKVFMRPQDDPLTSKLPVSDDMKIVGLINVVDLANIDSCCFIASDDAGTLHRNGTFEVTGRSDNTDARGCSLMFL